MKKGLQEFIQTLSKADKKTLTQKALKTTEEVGELAKAVLPFENAAGTLHRFVHKRQILENAVDTILCAYSIAYDLNFSDEEIESMMLEKATKWSGIQAKEGKVKFPLPYEIHITVSLKDSTYDLKKFKEICSEINVKPIVIELEKDGEKIMDDVMTSSVWFGDNNTALWHSEFLANQLKSLGFSVSRVKIETVPWHPAAPTGSDDMPDNSYFESHLRIVTTKKRKNDLEDIANEYDAHLSRNFFKKINDDEYIIMMTLRDDDTNYESFKEDVDYLKKTLVDDGFIVDKTEIEFAVFDSNVNHDIKWIGKED
jgi:hypothetical protein